MKNNKTNVTLKDMLSARENRQANIVCLTDKYKQTVVSFTLNIPGEIKDFPLARKTFDTGWQTLISDLENSGGTIVFQSKKHIFTGSEGYIVVDLDGKTTKTLAINIEDTHSLGRLFDIDIHTISGGVKREHLNYAQRKCYICGKDVWVCSRSRVHSVAQLRQAVESIMESYFNQN